MNLADSRDLVFKVLAGEATEADFSVDMAGFVDAAVSVQSSPSHLALRPGESAEIHLKIQTRSDAPSFASKEISLVAKSEGQEARAKLSLSVNPVYVVRVIDGDPFDFDSPDAELRFVPHAAGLQILFENASSRACVIHGEGAVEHQDLSQPLPPARWGTDGKLHPDPRGTYAPAKIMPYAGRNISSGYTIHGVYHPTRKLIVNFFADP